MRRGENQIRNLELRSTLSSGSKPPGFYLGRKNTDTMGSKSNKSTSGYPVFVIHNLRVR